MRSASTIRTLLTNVLVVMVGLIFIMPIVVMASTALKSIAQVLVVPFRWIPHPIMWLNFVKALTEQPFNLYFANSTMYSALALIGELLSCSIVAYAFVRFPSKWSKRMFNVVLFLLLMPYPVIIIPQFIMFSRIHWVGTYLPLIVPTFFAQSSFLVFLFRQFFQGIPQELFDAAEVDGAGPLRTFYRIVVPISGSVFATAAIFSFTYHWNDFLGPLVYLNQNQNYTVSLGLANFSSQYSLLPWNDLMAASIASVLPTLIIFFSLQRYFKNSMVISGIK